MKKLIASLFALAALCTAVAAQEKVTTVQDVTESSDANGKVVTTTTYDVHSVRTNRFWDNWSLGIGIGAQMYLGENDQYLKPGDWISPAFNIEVAKWLTPEFGLKLGVDFAQMKGLWQHYHPYLGPEYKEDWGNALYRLYSDDPYLTLDDPNGKWYYKQSTWTYGVYLLAMLDLNNAIAGYKEDRVWHSIIYAGGGILGSFGYRFPENLPEHLKTGATTYLSPSFNAGWLNSFRLTKNLDLNIDIRGKIVSDKFDGESRDDEPDMQHFASNVPIDGVIGAAVGVTWRFSGSTGNKEWREISSVSTVHYYDKTAASNAKELQRYREQYEKELARGRELAGKAVSNGVLEIPEAWSHINFVIGKADINEAEMAKIAALAEFIKATPADTKFRVTGYCDVQTASPAFNKKLSQKRSDAVMKALTGKFGVAADRLVADYKGGVDTMFLDDPQFSRCVMITLDK